MGFFHIVQTKFGSPNSTRHVIEIAKLLLYFGELTNCLYLVSIVLRGTYFLETDGLFWFLDLRVSQSCAERSSAAPKRGLASLADHAPVNMADSSGKCRLVDCFWIQRGDGVPKNFKDLRYLDVRNITQYSAAKVPSAFFFFQTSLLLTGLSVYRSVWPARS